MGESDSTAERFRYKSRLKGFSGRCISNMLLHSAPVSSSSVRQASWKPGLRLLRSFLRLLRMVHGFLWTLFSARVFIWLWIRRMDTTGRTRSAPRSYKYELLNDTWSNFWTLLLFDCHPFSSFCTLNFHCHSLQTELSSCCCFISLIVLRQNTALHRIFFFNLCEHSFNTYSLWTHKTAHKLGLILLSHL